MNAVPQEEVVSRLGKALPALTSCIARAWARYGEYPAELRMAHSSRSRASLIHDHAIDFARQHFDVHPGSQCQEIRKLFLVYFDAGIVVRFKKLDEKFRVSNIHTQQCMKFMDQLPLPSFGETINLHVGYRLNRLQTDLEGIYLACPNGPTTNAWVMHIGNTASGDDALSLVPHLPIPPAPPATAKKVVKFAPRKQDRGNGKASQ
jgi:hypothetical protein